MYLFFALILLVPMLALRPRRDGDAAILDPKSTTCIKGILAIYVMLHNLGLDLENGPFKELVCEHSGGIGVGLFFFLSAFGIVRSYMARGNKYLLRLLFIHIPKMWAVAVFINAITYFSFQRGAYEPLDTWLRILNFDIFNSYHRINRHGWYVATIILLYLVFAAVYFLCSLLKTNKKHIIAAIITCIAPLTFFLITLIRDNGGMYTREILTFAIGILYATFYERVNSLATKYFTPAIIVCTLGFAVGFIIFEDMATFCAAFIIILVSQKFTYFNKYTFFLGKICLGIYLFLHYSSIVLQDFLDREYLWVLTNAGFIILVAIMIYAVQYAIEYSIIRIKKWVSGRKVNATLE